ncbi:MAG: UDP-N-acetylmuramate dehydrogenase [Gammaproteobacteria bacterium]|jgi:UDP-N-acetylmuramate dehydrogenase
MQMTDSTKHQGTLRFDEPMSAHTSWRLGGPADRFFIPKDLESLQFFLSGMPQNEPIHWVGLGSNLLIRDGGIRGTVIAVLNALSGLHRTNDGIVVAECGVTCSKFARFCQKNGDFGGEFMAGIPGTIGGALAMNAGAFGGETWSFVERVDLIQRSGQIKSKLSAEFDVGYRSVDLMPDEWFVAAYFKLPKKTVDETGIRQLLKKRNDSQPIGLPSCGSVFKNPPGHYAAQLIEQSGLKGFKFRSVAVSDKHANFIISNRESSARDIEALIAHIQNEVSARFDIKLETEVRIIGEDE